jgi:hypothetical protein
MTDAQSDANRDGVLQNAPGRLGPQRWPEHLLALILNYFTVQN